MGQFEDSLLLLNDDVVFEMILPWLPPKSLLKFRSVSKSWYSAISHPDFIAKHQSHYGDYTNCFLSLLFPQKHDSVEKDFACSRYRIRSSCNGLLCYASPIVGDDDHIYLCNPSIRWTRTVVPFRFSSENNNPIYAYGVGSDGRSTDDYKVIRIEGNIRPHWPVEAALYSVKTNSWKQLNSVPEPPFYGYNVSIFLHGFIHWLSYNKSTYKDRKIVLFDAGNEVFGETKLPVMAKYRNRDIQGISISALRGSLCFLISTRDYDNRVFCDMWMMKEYGVAESWTKEAVVEFKMEIHRSLVSLQELSTQATVVGGKFTCELSKFERYFGSKLALFDPQTFENKKVSQPQQHSYIEAVSLVPSLQLFDVTR